MLLSIVFIILIAVIVYFHYLQGFFSAAISAILAIVSALLALSLHETIVHSFLKGRFADQAYALILISLFTVFYSVLRLIFDKLVPGNVRFPVLVDKIGAPVMGLIAGIFCIGILAIAAQSLPFAGTMAMYDRYQTAHDKKMVIRVPSKSNQDQDVTADVIDPEKFEKDQSTGLLLPADDMVVSLMSHVTSVDGSLSNGRPFSAIHPDYLQELFGQRAGMQLASRHTALPGSLTVVGLYTAPELKQADPEQFENGGKPIGIRGRQVGDKFQPKPDVRKPAPDSFFLVVRAQLEALNKDTTGVIALTPGAVRIAYNGQNYFMIGEMDGPNVLLCQDPDDYIFVSQGADLVFELPRSALQGGDKTTPPSIRPDSCMLEVKRMARVWLSGQVTSPIPPAPAGVDVDVQMKDGGPPKGSNVVVPVGKSAVSADSGQENTGPVQVPYDPVMRDTLLSAVAADQNGIADWGTFKLENDRFASIEMDAVRSLTMIGQGNKLVSQFFVPARKQMLQAPATSRDGTWSFVQDLAKFTLTDAAGNKIPAVGFMVKGTNANNQPVMVVRYNAQGTSKTPVTAEDLKNVKPTDIELLFLVPSGTSIKSMEYDGKTLLGNMQLQVP